MKTDDFPIDESLNEPQHDRPEDADLGGPKDPAYLDSDGFDEFDRPVGKAEKGPSLGELWRNNPIIKVAVVGVGVVAVITGLVMFGGDSAKTPKSDVGSSIQQREAPGAQTSPAYNDAINEVNQQRLDQAMQTGSSTMPIPVGGPNTPPVDAYNQEPPVTITDPLADWRASNQDTGAQQPMQPTEQGPQPDFQQRPGQRQQPLGPDAQAVDALAQAMGQQMQAILDKHKITGAQVMSVTDKDYFTKQAAANGGNGTGSTPTTTEVEEILIPAGTIVYAQTLTEANTDAPGPVLVRLASGPLEGSRMLGTFGNTEEFLTLDFNTIVVNGVSQSASAVALDPKTTLPAVATQVDHRYLRRFILPAAARFIQGMGDAIAQREQTNISVNGSTVTSSQKSLNTKQQLAAGLSDGTRKIGDELDREGDRTRVMIKVHAGTPIGILFLDPVIKPKD